MLNNGHCVHKRKLEKRLKIQKFLFIADVQGVFCEKKLDCISFKMLRHSFPHQFRFLQETKIDDFLLAVIKKGS